MPITHPVPPTGQNPWDATFRLWSEDVETSVEALEISVAGKVSAASPVFTGNPTAPTAAAGDNDTTLATTAFVQQAIAGTDIEDLGDVDSIPDGSLLMRDGVSVVGVFPADIDAADIPYEVGQSVKDALDELFDRIAAVESSSPALVNSVLPVITGSFVVGATVNVSGGTWTVGGVTQTPDSRSYQWKRSGVNISGATASSYTLVTADLGVSTISCQVTAIKAGHTNGVANAAAIDVSAGAVPLSIQNTAAGSSGATTTVNVIIPAPTGMANGDYLIAGLRSQTSAGASDFVPSSGSGAWARLGPAWPGSSATARVQGFFGHRVADTTLEPASYQFDRTSAATRNVGVIVNVRGVPNSGFLEVSSADYYGTDVTNGKQVASLTVVTNASYQFIVAGGEFTTGNDHVPATPAGFTLIAAAVTDGAVVGSSRTYVVVFQREVNAGATGTVNVVWPAAVGNPVAHSIVIRPA